MWRMVCVCVLIIELWNVKWMMCVLCLQTVLLIAGGDVTFQHVSASLWSRDKMARIICIIRLIIYNVYCVLKT